MALGYSTALRNAQLDQIATIAGGAAKLAIYDGTRPATGGAATTKLAELTGGTPFAPAAAGGVLTANAISQDASADATGTATWFRLTTSGGTFVMDGSVTATGGGGDLQLTTTSIVAGGPVTVTSFAITRGNA